jgi:hypothetical protein
LSAVAGRADPRAAAARLRVGIDRWIAGAVAV